MITLSHPTPDTTTLTDRPGCFWLFGLFFIAIGGLFVLGTMGLFHNADTLEIWERGAALIVGMMGVIAGVWIIGSSPRSHITIDRESVTITRRGLFGRETLRYPLHEVKQFTLITHTDSDGDPVYQPGMELTTGETVPLSILMLHDLPRLESTVNELNRWREV